MIGLLAVFGTLIAIGTIVDGILKISIMGSIISEKFIQVISFLYMNSKCIRIPLTIFSDRFSKGSLFIETLLSYSIPRTKTRTP